MWGGTYAPLDMAIAGMVGFAPPGTEELKSQILQMGTMILQSETGGQIIFNRIVLKNISDFSEYRD